MTAKAVSYKRLAEQQRARDLRQLFARVIKPYGILNFFGALPGYFSHYNEQDLPGKRAPQTGRSGKLVSKVGSDVGSGRTAS